MPKKQAHTKYLLDEATPTVENKCFYVILMGSLLVAYYTVHSFYDRPAVEQTTTFDKAVVPSTRQAYMGGKLRVAILCIGGYRVFDGTWPSHKRFIADVISRHHSTALVHQFVCTPGGKYPTGFEVIHYCCWQYSRAPVYEVRGLLGDLCVRYPRRLRCCKRVVVS